jgi:hypothetical protein
MKPGQWLAGSRAKYPSNAHLGGDPRPCVSTRRRKVNNWWQLSVAHTGNVQLVKWMDRDGGHLATGVFYVDPWWPRFVGGSQSRATGSQSRRVNLAPARTTRKTCKLHIDGQTASVGEDTSCDVMGERPPPPPPPPTDLSSR